MYMTYIQISNMSEYPTVVRKVVGCGAERSPRGLRTVDAGFTVVEIDDVTNGLPLGMGRGIQPAIGAVEALQLIAGVSRPELMLRIAPQFKRYMDGDAFHGAYGQRIGNQLNGVYRKLKEDKQTRRATVTLWDPILDNELDKHDYPCTIALNFYYDEWHALCMDTTMRSNDVILGFPYDVFQFTQLQITLARMLGAEPGLYRHTAWSMHAYYTDSNMISKLLQRPSDENTWILSDQPYGIGVRQGDSTASILNSDPVSDVRERARRILDDEPFSMTDHERWYYNAIHPQPTTSP